MAIVCHKQAGTQCQSIPKPVVCFELSAVLSENKKLYTNKQNIATKLVAMIFIDYIYRVGVISTISNIILENSKCF